VSTRPLRKPRRPEPAGPVRQALDRFIGQPYRSDLRFRRAIATPAADGGQPRLHQRIEGAPSTSAGPCEQGWDPKPGRRLERGEDGALFWRKCGWVNARTGCGQTGDLAV